MVILHIGKTKYQIGDTEQAVELVKEYCDEKCFIHTAPVKLNKVSYINVLTKSGKHVTTCKIYDKR